MAFLGHSFISFGNFLKTTPYIQVSGKKETAQCPHPCIFHLNTCMMPGSLPLQFAGLLPASNRLELLVTTIKKNDPDLLLLSEVNASIASILPEKLKNDFTQFYTKIGMKGFGMESGLFVASRIALRATPKFIPFSHQGSSMQRFVRRGFFYLETKQSILFYTHLHPGKSEKDQEIRHKQLKEISEIMENFETEKPLLLIGDLNIDYRRGNELSERLKEAHLRFLSTPPSSSEETCSEKLEFFLKGKALSSAGEFLDYALCRQRDHIQAEVSYEETYIDPPKKGFSYSLSDHKGIKILLKS